MEYTSLLTIQIDLLILLLIASLAAVPLARMIPRFTVNVVQFRG